jgi:hypothetical protein
MAESKDERHKKRVKEYEAEYVAKKSKGPLPASEYTPVGEQRRRIGLPPNEDDPLFKAQEEARDKIVGTKRTRGFSSGGKVRGDGCCVKGHTKGRMR